jgi:hypothetical protein
VVPLASPALGYLAARGGYPEDVPPASRVGVSDLTHKVDFAWTDHAIRRGEGATMDPRLADMDPAELFTRLSEKLTTADAMRRTGGIDVRRHRHRRRPTGCGPLGRPGPV